MPARWAQSEVTLLKKLWSQGESFEGISDALAVLNRKRGEVEGYDRVAHRTPRAVAIKCEKFGLIAKSRLKNWEEHRTRETSQKRRKDLSHVRTAVFARDGNECVICRAKDSLEFAHIIPFRDTGVNRECEAVTLCSYHHKDFDAGCDKCNQKVFERMTSLYPDFELEYLD